MGLELLLHRSQLDRKHDTFTLILTDGQITGAFTNVLSGGRLDARQDTDASGTEVMWSDPSAWTTTGIASRSLTFKSRQRNRRANRSCSTVSDPPPFWLTNSTTGGRRQR